ncbi:PDT-domain-containing protein [Hypoxylon sp. FL1284]|nr:PDT-domain-containing protein [Hypoxylon sp. FL1284]
MEVSSGPLPEDTGLGAAAGTATGAATSATPKPTVCFLGPIGSYTHQATLDTFPEERFDLLPVETIKDIFTTTQSGRADYGVVPFENSTNGSVVFTLDQFADRDGEFPDLSVCAEAYLAVHHCLLGRIAHELGPPSSPMEASKDPLPQHDLSHIERVYSHPQAFGQCTRFLRALRSAAKARGDGGALETVDVSSTSRAAELAAADASGRSAAVGSAVAARLLGLDVLARAVEDRDDNVTRFFVLRRRRQEDDKDNMKDDVDPEWLRERRRRRRAAVRAAAAAAEGEEDKKEATTTPPHPRAKALASFAVPHHRHPGALADVLDCFRRARLNLTSINSRPSLAAPFRYVFFVEFEFEFEFDFRSDGDNGGDDPDPGGRVRRVLADVAGVAPGARWLGTWDSMR